MTVIRPNSISGITSITAQANEINVFRSNGLIAGLNLNGVNFNTTAGISTLAALKVTGNLDVEGVLTYQDVTNVDSLGIGTFRTGINVSGGQLDVGSNIKLGNAGVITATSFVGSGANLTSLPAQATIANNADNRVITGGSGVNLNGESNLTFDGAKLNITTNSAGFRITRNSQYLELDANSGNGGDQCVSSSANFRIQTGGVGNSFERVRITSDGKVGINDNNPANQLVVKAPGGSGHTVSSVMSGDATTRVTMQAVQGTEGRMGMATNHPLAIYAGALERLRIESDGQVVINRPSGAVLADSSTKLEVYNSTENLIFVANSTAATSQDAGIIFAPANNVYGGKIIVTSDEDFSTSANRSAHMALYTRKDGTAAERVRITSTGQFVVGNDPTVGSGNIVHIEAPTSFNSGETIVNIEGDNATAGPRLVLHNNNTGASAHGEILGADAGGQSTSSIRFYNTDQSNNYGEIAFGTRNQSGVPPTDRMRITKEGNIIYKDKDSGHTGGGRYSRTKTVTTSGDATSSFMRFSLDHGAIAGMIFLTASNSGYSVAKTYAFVAQYGQTVTTNLLADTGSYSGANISFTSSTNNNQHNFMVQVSGQNQEVNMTVIMGNANQNITYTEL